MAGAGGGLGPGSWCEGDDPGVLSTFLLPLLSQPSPPPLPQDRETVENFSFWTWQQEMWEQGLVLTPYINTGLGHAEAVGPHELILMANNG